MSIESEFGSIIKKGRVSKIIPFLQSLSPGDRKVIAKEVPRYKYVWEYNWWEKNVGGVRISTSGKPKGSDEQKKILIYATFVCCNFRALTSQWGQRQFIDLPFLESVLSWTVPNWIDKYINEVSADGWHHHSLDYFELLSLQEKGYFEVTPETIATKICTAIYQGTVQGHNFWPKRLLEKPVMLDEHFWYLFQYETEVAWTVPTGLYEEHRKGKAWLDAVELYMDEGRIKRLPLLKEALLAGNRGFNKRVSGGFMQIPLHFKPTKPELIDLADVLISTLSSPHSKVVNTALKYIKVILNEPVFDIEAFLDFLPSLLTSETKSVVNSTLIILDKLAKSHDSLRSRLVALSFQAFILQDAGIQVRAARFIAKYLSNDDQDVMADLMAYAPQLMFEAREVLAPFLTSTVDEVDISGQEEEFSFGQETLADLPVIPEVNSVDELVFLASQVFDNHEPYHLDQFLAALLRQYNQLSIADFKKLLPAFQRAHGLISSEWTPNAGDLDYLLALFFLHFGRLLIDRLGGYEKIREDTSTGGFKESQLKWFTQQLRPMSYGLKRTPGTPVYAFMKEYLDFVLDKLRSGDKISLLSTPTHAPAWIDPAILIDRLAVLQEKRELLNELDLQLAVSRCYPGEAELAEKIETALAGEFRALFGLLYLGETAVPAKTKWPRVWQTAIVSKQSMLNNEMLAYRQCFKADIKTYLLDFKWSVEERLEKGQSWDPVKRAMQPHQYMSKSVHFEKPRYVPRKSSLLEMAKALAVPRAAVPATRPLLTSFEIRSSWEALENNDIERFFGMCPNNCEYLLQSLASGVYRWPTFTGEDEKRLVAATLTAMMTYRGLYSSIWSDFLGMSLLASDKVVRTIAGEVWSAHLSGPGFDNQRVGVAIARYTVKGFVPLKRFLETASLILTHSTMHEKGMYELLSACISNMEDVPLTNTKLLLTIFLETRKSAKEPLPDHVLNKLNHWCNTKSLTAIINKLVKT